MKRGQVEMVFRTHGGKRRGAGRKPKGARARQRHEARPEHDPRHPVHVTIRGHHGEDRAPFARTWKVDPFSSGALFTDWKELEGSPVLWPLPPAYQPLLVFRPRTWLLRSWHRFHPLISVREVPGRPTCPSTDSDR